MAARTLIPVIPMSRFSMITATTPSAPVTADTANGNVSPNDGYTYLEMTNSSGASRTVNVTLVGNVDQDLTTPVRPYVMASNGVYETGVFPVTVYGAQLLYTATGSGVSIRAISLRGGV
jgi:hypothetical protein